MFSFCCQAISCGHPGIPSQGKVRIGGLTFGESVFFECNDFYEIYGESELTCEADGLWSDEIPSCWPGMECFLRAVFLTFLTFQCP